MIQFLVSSAGAVSASSAGASGADGWEWLSRISTILEIAGVFTGAAAVFLGWTLFKYIKRRKECRQLLKKEYVTAVKEIKRCYIHTRGQKDNPGNYSDLTENYGPGITTDLLKHFLKIVFNPRQSEKYYMILADSGMGKTTFMVKLYTKYMCSLYRRGRKKMRILYLGSDTCLEEIKNIEEKGETILLLDALDERQDVNNNKEAEAFLNNLLLQVEPFYRVIITCRSQYFPDQKSEPDLMPFLSRDIGNKEVHIHRFYLSPFSEKAVRKYIRKKYPWYDFSRRKKAFTIAKKIPALTARPLILSWLDDLMENEGSRLERKIIQELTIYESIVNSWIKRESNRLIKDSRGRSITGASAAEAGRRLRMFTVELAKYMLWNDIQQVSLDEVKRIAEQHQVDISQFSAQGRSLLNRNANGVYKFAHKSFYDFFVAYAYAHYPEQWITDKARRFSDFTYKFIIQMSVRSQDGENPVLVPLGEYPQDADGTRHMILWRPVKQVDGLPWACFISDKVLDYVPEELIQMVEKHFDSNEWSIYLKAYLNGTLFFGPGKQIHIDQSFASTAFSDSESNRIFAYPVKTQDLMYRVKVLLPDKDLVDFMLTKARYALLAEETSYAKNLPRRPQQVGKKAENYWVLDGLAGIVSDGELTNLQAVIKKPVPSVAHEHLEAISRTIVSNTKLGIRPVIWLEF